MGFWFCGGSVCVIEGMWECMSVYARIEPLSENFHPAYIFKTDIRKIIIPKNPEEEKEISRKERSWFTETK